MPAKIKKKPGRPRIVIDDTVIEHMCQMAKTMLSIDSICTIKGFSRETFYEHCKTHPEHLAKIHSAKSEGKLALANTAMHLAVKDKNPMIVKYMNQVHNKWLEPREAQQINVAITLESLIARASEQIEAKPQVIEGEVATDE